MQDSEVVAGKSGCGKENHIRKAGGKPIAVIELTDDPYQEKFAEISHEDFIAEGGYFYWQGRLDFIDLLKGAGKGDTVWVVKFKLRQVPNG